MEENPNIAGGETGICRFCGQMVNVQWLRGFENHKDRDADYLASRFCGCPDSKKYAEAEQRREDAAAMRMKRYLAKSIPRPDTAAATSASRRRRTVSSGDWIPPKRSLTA